MKHPHPGARPSAWRPIRRLRWRVAMKEHLAYLLGWRDGRRFGLHEASRAVERIAYPQR